MVLNPEDAVLLSSQHLVAKRRQGARGTNKRVLSADSPAGELARFDLYQEFLPRRREYRVSVLSGQVVSAYRKQPASEAETENLRPQWRFERGRVPCLEANAAPGMSADTLRSLFATVQQVLRRAEE